MAPDEALIDVLIPAYNAAATIESAVDSIQRQTVRNIRIIVVNDGSTDATGEILARLAAQDSRIEVVTQPNGGIVDALNAGLALCRAAYVARHDADDLAFPDRLEKQHAYMSVHAECIAVGANAWHIDADGRRTGRKTFFEGPVAPDPYWAASREPYLMHPFLLVRRQALVDAGGYRYVFHSEDTDLYWRLLDLGELFNMPDVLGEYRLHAQSVSSASVVNGRIAAVNSQLAALSYRRRRQGREDIGFSKETLAAYHAARSLEGVVAVAAAGLTAEETRYLRLAATTKLMNLARYRSYELEIDDIAFLKRALRDEDELLSRENRREIGRLRVTTCARLLKAGRVQAFLALVEPSDLALLARRAIGFVAKRVGLRKLRPAVAI